MKIKPLIQLKLLGLFLFSCTIDANLNEDYNSKVKGMLNRTKDDKEKAAVNTNPNVAKNIPVVDKVAAELKKQEQVTAKAPAAKNKGLQNQPQVAKAARQQTLGFGADLSNLSKTTNINTSIPTAGITKTKDVSLSTLPIIRRTTQKGKAAPKATSTFSGINHKPPAFTLSYTFSQPTSQPTSPSIAVQATTSSSGDSKLQELKNELIRTIAEEKNTTQNNFGFRETHDQFNMKDSVFELIDVISNGKVFDRSYAPKLSSNTPEAENERNRLYALMDFDPSKITRFGAIMDLLYDEEQNHSLIRELIISGLGTQISFELALDEINKKIEIFNQDYLNTKINSFDFTSKLNTLQSKLNQIVDEKDEWARHAFELINYADPNYYSGDSKSLAEYIQNNYIDKMQNARQSVLETYISITELK
ncbi:borrelia PFam54 protein (plasmid) [Borreliella bissettiae DN127]|uniref:Borrelia PFam54 protein n=1 Tax=Borrelia bissettiae (strain DSM 17990 / CIP 109136 / DN127) TaxID=521010 RepID=G0API5_BORBD|nr:complement regulator-acquiring protein [Borreliella bissettiae]AEL19611.1 borrelia PFam54 protein [Borreliella bissettiae DN127]